MKLDMATKTLAYLTVAAVISTMLILISVWLRPPIHMPNTISIGILTVVSLFVSIFILKINIFYSRVICFVFTLVVFHFIFVEFAKIIVRFIGFYITSSQAYGRSSYLDWDDNLRNATYVLYGLIFTASLVVMHYMYRKHCHIKIYKLALVTTFFMSVPTVTSWKIASTCGGFGGYCQENLMVITPVIMSINPFNMCISISLAYLLYKKYESSIGV